MAMRNISATLINLFRRNGEDSQVVEDTSNPSNNVPLPVKLMGADGAIINIDGGLGYNIAEPETEGIAITANTETPYTFLATVKEFKIKARSYAQLRLSYESGGTVNNYLTLSPGSVYYVKNVAVDSPLTVYIKANKNDVLEIEAWHGG